MKNDAAAPAPPIPVAAGIGLRFAHHAEVLDRIGEIAWVEVHPENYMARSAALAQLERVRRDRALSLHGVGLSLGSALGIDRAHLSRLAAFAARLEPGMVSEHVAWSIADGAYLADLLPLPMTEEALDVVCRNVGVMQDALRRRVLLENPSSYVRYCDATVPEWEFMAELARRSGCGILCDVNNIEVGVHNHGFDPIAYIQALPPDAVGEIHVAGHSIQVLPGGGGIRLDDHGSPVSDPVWGLLDAALRRFGALPVLVEWDNALPKLDVLLAEAGKAQHRVDRARELADAIAA